MAENIEVSLQQLKDITTRMNRILEGNGLPGLIQKVTFLETQRVLDRKDVDAITTIVRSIEQEANKITAMGASLESISCKVNATDYTKLMTEIHQTTKSLEEHLQETKEKKSKAEKLTSAVNSAVLVYVALGVLKILFNALGINIP